MQQYRYMRLQENSAGKTYRWQAARGPTANLGIMIRAG